MSDPAVAPASAIAASTPANSLLTSRACCKYVEYQEKKKYELNADIIMITLSSQTLGCDSADPHGTPPWVWLPCSGTPMSWASARLTAGCSAGVSRNHQ